MTTRAELKSYLDDLKLRFLADPNAAGIEKTISARIDDIIQECWGTRVPPKSFALMAIGGYGRGTIHPESDIDLLFFFKESIDEEAIKSVLHPLWGLQFKVGHQIRHTDDFKEFDDTHMESYTAFLDCRFLVGDPAVAHEFENEILQDMIRKNRTRFLKSLAGMKAARYTQFGDTIFQLEPDLKEAPGGLRDIHWSGWVRKSLGASPDHMTPPDALGFHHQVRNFLHFNSNRNFNVLSFEFQEQIADKLAYKASQHGDAAENLMRDYFLRAAEIAREARFWEEAIVGRPNTISVNSDFSDPFEMIDAFAEAHRKNALLDSATLETIRQRLATANGAISNHPRAGRIVLEMMKDRKGIYEVLLAMHEVGLLGRIFPDFEEIRCRVIRDFFHKYTVDEHSLIAIRNIEQLPSSHHFSVLLNELENPELLLLSLLFHDIGKAHRHDEGNHVHPSTEGVKVILGKLEIPADQAEKVIFAVKAHLEMSKIILRRDFSDPQVIRQFADMVGNAENLRMLCLLTYADMKAVNNEVVTPWKEDLLWQLYVETYNQITLGLADDQYSQQQELESDIDAITKLLPPGTPSQHIRDFLDGFPRQYLRTTQKRQIADHFLLSRKLADRPMVMHMAKNGAVYDLLVMTADRPGLFSKITGVLSYFGMNIVRAQAFSNRHGTIFDLISFEDPDRYFEKNPSEVDQFAKVLNDVIRGTVQLSTLLDRKFKSVVFRQKKGLTVPMEIHFDDEFSKRCTIMEIVVQDAFGLLYRVASVIASHGCNIEVALITTEGHRALDVFYITRQGKKVEPDLEEQLKGGITTALQHAD
ncbi:MAG TPA: HD domain-containing protein [Terriglobia bacterium]|jgi:[protein-PII] uridylyltransferase